MANEIKERQQQQKKNNKRLSRDEVNSIINEFVKVRDIYYNDKSKENLKEYNKHKNICLEKFKFLISNKTIKYYQFPNYEDINQEGVIGLLYALHNFKPEKGAWLYWANRYINTRISRVAHNHATMKFSFAQAKKNIPIRKSFDEISSVESEFHSKIDIFDLVASKELINRITKINNVLSKEQKEIISLAFGFDDNRRMGLYEISMALNISLKECSSKFKSALRLCKSYI